MKGLEAMKGRTFTPEFKLKLVRAVLSGEKPIIQLCREHNLSDSLIHNWKKLYREKGEAAFTAPTQSRTLAASTEQSELEALRQRVGELERLAGQQALEISILKKSRRC
ncbi:MAG: transposase [Chloroflexi bacterium]|uniref:Transposase n=1 Tax=Candidatus Chlorohelix allophototropha TaxID=3003348 RepID=A0A8T7M3B7_9CHLR|nr:transposase [Chloroflexota bacterium]WJW67544.1 transposase [Chloroflexota bacterium L227-S17]